MDTRARGRGRAGARGGRAVARGGRVGGRGGRGRGRGRAVESVESAAQSSSQSVAAASESQSRGAGGGRGVPVGPGGGAAVAPGRDDQVVGLLTQLLARFPPVQAPGVPPVAGLQQGAAVAEQPRAEVAVQVPSYLEMMGQLQRIGTPFFEGSVSPEAADEWRLRLERNFRSIRCPAEYQVELAVHYLSGDAHCWWRAIEARRAEWTWGEFLAEFHAKYFPQEARDRLQMRFMSLAQGELSVREYDAEFSRLVVHSGHGMDDERVLVQRFLQGLRLSIRTQCRGGRFVSRAELVELAASIEEDQREQSGPVVAQPVVAHAVQPRSQQPQQHQQRRGSAFGSGSGFGSGDRPARGQKRRREDPSRASSGRDVSSRASSGSRVVPGCFGCGSLDHRVASCPKASRGSKGCFQCGEMGHFRSACPQLQRPVVAAFQPVGAQSSSQIAAVQQPVSQIGPAPHVFSPSEFGQSSGAGQITGKF